MTEFAVWAPGASRVRLRVVGEQDRDLRRGQDGWWSVAVPHARAGTDYAFLIDDSDQPLPDPRSAWQPRGVHGPSRLYDHAAYAWSDGDWAGRHLPGSVLYHLHVGTFTEAGTFDSAIERLDHLVKLGVDLVELLPVNAFDGEHDRGCDGAGWFAPHEPYGGPDALKRLVDACHARGLGVILDVHHCGHPGPYAPVFAPDLAESGTGSGGSIGLDGPYAEGVRRHLLESILMWLRDYHVDGLRLDTEHALSVGRAGHLVDETAAEVEALATHVRRPLWLLVEVDPDDPSLGARREFSGSVPAPWWNDEARYARYTVPTGNRQGDGADARPVQCLDDVFTAAMFQGGTWSSYLGGAPGGNPSRVPSPRFAYPRQHDRIGIPAAGDRIAASLTGGLLRVGVTLLMTAPVTPRLWMGEEWAATTPRMFSTSRSEPELTTTVAAGRRREFAARGPSAEGRVADPLDPQVHARPRLDWAELDQPGHREMLDFYRRLIALRKSRPELSGSLDRVDVRYGYQFVVVRRGRCVVAANLAAKAQRVTLPGVVRAVLLATGGGVTVMRGGVELPAESAVVVAA